MLFEVRINSDVKITSELALVGTLVIPTHQDGWKLTWQNLSLYYG